MFYCRLLTFSLSHTHTHTHGYRHTRVLEYTIKPNACHPPTLNSSRNVSPNLCQLPLTFPPFCVLPQFPKYTTILHRSTPLQRPRSRASKQPRVSTYQHQKHPHHPPTTAAYNRPPRYATHVVATTRSATWRIHSAQPPTMTTRPRTYSCKKSLTASGTLSGTAWLGPGPSLSSMWLTSSTSLTGSLALRSLVGWRGRGGGSMMVTSAGR